MSAFLPFFEKIKSIAESSGKTLAQIERESGLPRGTLKNTKTHAASIDTAAKLADCLDVSVDYLLGRESAADQPLDGKERRLLDFYRSMSEYGQSQLLEYAEMASARYAKKIDIPADSEEELKNA